MGMDSRHDVEMVRWDSLAVHQDFYELDLRAMRNISFSLTTRQFRDRSKTVTRRTRWENLKAGDRLMGIVKGMGLKKGEKVERLGEIEVVQATREPLSLTTDEDAKREGFPELTGAQFVDMYCRHQGGTPDQIVTRIEFKYVE